MGFLKNLRRKDKKRESELADKVEEFRAKVNQLGRDYGMAITPITTKYGLEIEIQVLTDKEKAEIDEKEKEIGEGQKKEDG